MWQEKSLRKPDPLSRMCKRVRAWDQFWELTWLTLGTGSHFGFQVCIQAPPPHTASCPAFHPCNAWVYMYFTQFLDYSLSSWWLNNNSCTPKYTTIQHTRPLPPPTLLHSSLRLMRRPTMDHKSCSKYWLAWLSIKGNTLVSKYSMSKRRLPGIGTTVEIWVSGKQHSLVNRLGWKQT